MPHLSTEPSITVEFSDFDQSAYERASVRDCFSSESGSITSSITYLYRPKLGLDVTDLRSLNKENYEFYYCCNEDISRRITDLAFQKYMPMYMLPALRDAAGDLQIWRRSPLSQLIERLKIDREQLTELGQKVDEVISEILLMPPINQLQNNIETRISQMVGVTNNPEPNLGFLPSDPDRLLRFLRLFAEGEAQRSLEDIGSGYANIVYLALLLLDAREKEIAVELATMLLAVEEPEAHLHPHLQRLVFSDLFQSMHRQNEIDTKKDNQIPPVFITTHSPHIASVAPLRSILMLKKSSIGTVGRNILMANLSNKDIRDIERYLDVTKAELVFSKGIILVEGIVEAILINEYARNLGRPLDELGISIVIIDCTDFSPYVKLLSSNSLDIRTAIVTDGDPNDDGSVLDGLERGTELFKLIYENKLELVKSGLSHDAIREGLAYEGIFVGRHTIEIDLVDAGYGSEYLWIFREFGESHESIRNTIDVLRNWSSQDIKNRDNRIVNKIKRVCGKGRFAQRLAARIDPKKNAALY